MSEKNMWATKPPDELSALELERLIKKREKVFGILLEKLKPWLFEFGNWMFGGLIAFNLVIVAPLLTLGSLHLEIVVAIVAFACALPLNVSGLFSLKLLRDMDSVAIDTVIQEAFKGADDTDERALETTSEKSELLHKQRTDVGLRYAIRLAAISAVLTLLGMIAALWYIAWWVAVIFVVVVIVALATTLNFVTRLMRPDPEAERQLRQRYQAQRERQREERRKAKKTD